MAVKDDCQMPDFGVCIMLLDELRKMIETRPGNDPARQDFLGVVRLIKDLKDEKRSLNRNNQELLKLLDEEKRRHNDLSFRVRTNPRTGLPNHHKMSADLDEILGKSRSYLDDHRGALFFLRLDRSFKAIQTQSKVQVVEWVLYQIATRLKEITEGMGEDGVSIYHTREDEFMLIIKDQLTLRDCMSLGRRLRSEMRKPHIFAGHNYHLDCHVGIAQYPQHGTEKSLLLHNADIALQVAEERKENVVMYHPMLREQVIEKMELQNSIIRALEQQAIQEIGKQFEIFYQPIYTLKEVAPGTGNPALHSSGSWVVESISAEALIRWHHPTKGTIAPDRFIPIAEETGLIIPIGNWIIYSVADQLKQWRDEGRRLASVSVNLSTRQFHSDTLTHTVSTAMKNNNLDPESLRFEITESSLAENPEQMIETMWSLHKKGIYFYIDDFGTGYSSLSYVHQMPIKRIKIDKSFVLNLSEKKRERVIIRTIIAMAKELDFGLVAEGVEQESQLNFLLENGVYSFQGFHFSRPLPAAEFEKLLPQGSPD